MHNNADEVNLKPALQANKSLGRLWIAMAAFAAIGLMGMSAWRQGWFTPTENLYLRLNDGTQGVQIGTSVKLKGFKIGEVDQIKLEPNLDVIVRIRIEEEKMALLGSDALFKLTRDNPLAAKYLEFIAGSRVGARLQASTFVPLHTGGDVEDIMLIVKDAVGKLNIALGRVDPILEDVKKLTSEAESMRGAVHSSVDVMLANLKALSAQLNGIGVTANGMATQTAKDRDEMVSELKTLVTNLESTVSRDVPALSAQLKAALEDVRSAASNVNNITQNAAQEVPPILRSTRAWSQDAAEITVGAKKTWPISSMLKEETTGVGLQLDAFEAQK